MKPELNLQQAINKNANLIKKLPDYNGTELWSLHSRAMKELSEIPTGQRNKDKYGLSLKELIIEIRREFANRDKAVKPTSRAPIRQEPPGPRHLSEREIRGLARIKPM